MKKKLVCIISIVLIASCNQNPDNVITRIYLEPSVVIEELRDSTYFRGISHMFYDHCIYASDDINGRILQLDLDLNLLSTIGTKGQGPGEFFRTGSLAVWKDTVLAINMGGLTLNTYTTDGKYIDGHSFVDDPSLSLFNFCMDNEGFLYFTSHLDSFPVVKYDQKMNRLFGFGEWIEPENQEFRLYLNNYLVHYFDDKILTLQLDAPIINLYGKDGQHLLKKELPALIFEKRLRFKQIEQAKDAANLRKIYGLFSSLTSIDNKLYLLYVDHDYHNLPFSNKVVELIFEDNDFFINKVYTLTHNGWFLSIVATNDNRLIASNASMQVNPALYVYPLK